MKNNEKFTPIDIKEMKSILKQIKKDGLFTINFENKVCARFNPKASHYKSVAKFMEVFSNPLVGYVKGDCIYINEPVLSYYSNERALC